MRPPASRVRHAPTASKFSSAKPIGSMTLWQVAQAGFARCSAICSRMVFGFSPAAVSFSAGTSGGRRRDRRTENIFQNEFAAEHRGRALCMGGNGENAALPQQSFARVIGDRDAPEAAAIDVGNAVVAAPAVH